MQLKDQIFTDKKGSTMDLYNFLKIFSDVEFFTGVGNEFQRVPPKNIKLLL